MKNDVFQGGIRMVTAEVTFDTIRDVKAFVAIAGKYPFDIDLISGRYIVDGKSIMGILSLNLANPIDVEIHCDKCSDFLKEIKPFMSSR